MRMIPYRDERLALPAFNRLVESFFPEERAESLWPSIDVVETPETIEVKVELPGIDPKDIEISVVRDTLTIKGEKRSEKEEKGKSWHRRERAWGSFCRTVTLPMEIDAEHVEAVGDVGVLTITLPKREGARAKRIPIRAK